jgi:glycogen debranching enzyme
MMNELVVLDGSTFFLSDDNGDVIPRDHANGFFFADMRHLSTWQVLVNGQPLRVLTSANIDYYSARIFGTLPEARVSLNPPVSVRRDRFVSEGIHEDVVVQNNSADRVRVRVEIRFAADFADIFEVKDKTPKQGHVSSRVTGPDRVVMSYEHDGYRRRTEVIFSMPVKLTAHSAVFELDLGPRETWQTCCDISPEANGRLYSSELKDDDFGKGESDMSLTLAQWLEQAPGLETSWDTLHHTYVRSWVDLAALRFRPFMELEHSLPAAGMPWFMALFGRDSLLTSFQVLPFEPYLARTTLKALAGLQATEMDDFRDAEPGKILHELRRGELAVRGEAPQSPYYGTHDATPLFLILLDEYERWTGDLDFVRSLEPAARAALEWIERYGDLDGDGYLEYRTRSPKGLGNQCWKDSWNSILFHDGSLAEPPIATCEIQGYAYDARLRTARLARLAWNDESLAGRLESDARRLKKQFDRDFWNEEIGSYVLALDGRKRQVDSLTSNTGHLLWSGILDDDRAARVVERLMAPEMFTGWGFRSMSSNDAGYNPIEYHDGTVWPHDASFIAEGMRRYGYREEAASVAQALFEAAAHFDYRLPEVFAGFARVETRIPVEYPTASSPQAWAAGAPLLALRTLLGIDVIDGRFVADPHVPESIGRLTMRGIPVRGSLEAADSGQPRRGPRATDGTAAATERRRTAERKKGA